MITTGDGGKLMKDKFNLGGASRRWLPWFACVLALGWLGMPDVGAEQIKDKVKEKIKGLKTKLEGPAVKCIKVPGALLASGLGKNWQSLKPGDLVPSGQTVVALPSAELRSLNDAVEVQLVVDMAERGPFPLLETAAAFSKHPQADLAITLERGIMVVANRKTEGEARVVLNIHGKSVEMTLREPGSRLAVIIFSRQVPGKPKLVLAKQDSLHTNLMFLALQGRILLGTERQSDELRAPPGQAMLLWDSVTQTPEVKRLDKLPDFTKEIDPKEAKLMEKLCQHARRLVEQDIGQSLQQLVRSADKEEREIGIVGLGALDQVPALLDALADEKYSDLRENAIIVLRHWLGRSPEQLAKLQLVMLKDKRFTVIQARLLLHMLVGFTDRERMEPTTYDFLIHLLEHPKLAVRELARWHLVRLAPAGKDILFDAAGSADDRQKAVAQWRALIPSGQLPPPVRSSLPKKGLFQS